MQKNTKNPKFRYAILRKSHFRAGKKTAGTTVDPRLGTQTLCSNPKKPIKKYKKYKKIQKIQSSIM